MLPCTICPNLFFLLFSVVSVYCRCDCLLVQGAVGALALTHGTLEKNSSCYEANIFSLLDNALKHADGACLPAMSSEQS
jgi:hypothetical protein